tara:strand:- start:486 stop:704 length:219 start_codon:yes stop_codon:yes gene_type:complete
MIDIEELEYEYSAFFGDKEGEHNLLKRMKPLLAEVKRLRMSNTLLRDTLSEVLDLHASYDNIVRIIHQVLEE